MPKVSICVPTYNNVDDVKRLLESIARQTYKDYEINISDDSTDDEIKTLVSQFDNIHYIKNEKPLGHIFNWNAAIKMAAGEYIKIMFSDDWFTFDDSLESFVTMLDLNPQADFAFCGSRQVLLVDDVDKLKRSAGDHKEESYDRCAPSDYIEELKKDYRYLFMSNQVGCPSATMYRRSKAAGLKLFDEKSNWASDVFLYMDVLQANPNFVSTDKPLICVGMHEHQYTETFDMHDMRIYNDYKYMYQKYNLSLEEKYRLYFLKKYIIGFKQNRKEAIETDNGLGLYWTYKIDDFFETLGKFISNRFKKKK